MARARARNNLTAHKDATEFAMRKCIYETQRAKNELEWQKANVSVTGAAAEMAPN